LSRLERGEAFGCPVADETPSILCIAHDLVLQKSTFPAQEWTREMEFRARRLACADPPFEIQVGIRLLGASCSERGDAKRQEETRGDQRLFACVFMKHHEAGQDGTAVEIDDLGPFWNEDLIHVPDGENPTALDDQRLVFSGWGARAIDGSDVSQSDA
jgi:hypothetical protein